VVAARPDGFICEYGIGPRAARGKELREVGPSPMMTELPVKPFEVVNGYIRVPEGQGLGIELNPESLERWSLS